MPAISINSLIGAFDSDDLEIRRDGNGDSGAQWNAAFNYIQSLGLSGARINARPGTFRIVTAVVQPDGIEVVGAGPGTIFQLGPNAYVDVWQMNGGARLRRVKIDGNRANNALGTRYGLWLNGCTYAIVEDVEVINARSDGIRLDNCSRPILIRPVAHDNGRNGICLSYCQNHEIEGPQSYDNCRVSAAGTADGIRFELLTGDGSVTNARCFESALAGQLHGFGIREAPGESCYRNFIFGGSQQGNINGGVSLESSDSTAITPTLIAIRS